MFNLFNKKREKSYTAHIELPIESEGQRKHLEACLQSPRLVLALKDITSSSSELECIGSIKDKDARRGAIEAFKYIRNLVNSNLGEHKHLIE